MPAGERAKALLCIFPVQSPFLANPAAAGFAKIGLGWGRMTQVRSMGMTRRHQERRDKVSGSSVKARCLTLFRQLAKGLYAFCITLIFVLHQVCKKNAAMTASFMER